MVNFHARNIYVQACRQIVEQVRANCLILWPQLQPFPFRLRTNTYCNPASRWHKAEANIGYKVLVTNSSSQKSAFHQKSQATENKRTIEISKHMNTETHQTRNMGDAYYTFAKTSSQWLNIVSLNFLKSANFMIKFDDRLAQISLI